MYELLFKINNVISLADKAKYFVLYFNINFVNFLKKVL